MPGGDKQRPVWLRFSGIGIEFAAAVIGCSLVGYWVDRHYGCRPWGVVVGAGVGLIGGTYNFVRESMSAFKQAQREDEEHRTRK
ncbi:MAG: AtpZ/AtpI family protein [Planctomycetes bacterium]|nr:AtpZ/AtpI family protein [Planctomycetota bacterium]